MTIKAGKENRALTNMKIGVKTNKSDMSFEWNCDTAIRYRVMARGTRKLPTATVKIQFSKTFTGVIILRNVEQFAVQKNNLTQFGIAFRSRIEVLVKSSCFATFV